MIFQGFLGLVSLNYKCVRLVGACVLGGFFGSAATLFFYQPSENRRTLLLFIPLTVVFTLSLIWFLRRGGTSAADPVQRQYEEGKRQAQRSDDEHIC
jgi:hypothetical protein